MSDIYREELMEIYRNPSHKGKVDSPSVEVFEKNPMCGDELTLQLKIEEGIIKEACFEGSACAVSVISSDVLLDHIKGKTVSEAKNLSKDDLLNLLNLNLSTSRVNCAMLVLNALKKGLNDYEKNN